MGKPVIGITPYHNTETGDIYMRRGYPGAIAAVGGIPVILPLTDSAELLMHFADTLDGFLFAGGPDVHAFHFGEQTHASCGNVSPLRDSMELMLLPLVMKHEKPVLGICRGIQVMNISLGGDIYQDIPSQMHRNFPIAHSQPFSYEIPSHTVSVTSGSLLESIITGSELFVNSMHHQAVRRLAPGLRASASAPDGVIEAIEQPDYPFFLGVQWHPEYLWQKQPAMFDLFHTFVGNCLN